MKPLSATEAAARIEAGTLTSETLVRACLERIAEREPTVKAWAYLDPDLALAQAKAADAAKGGVLRGVPFGVKDIFDTAQMPSGYGSPIYTGCRPSFDASAVALPRAAGAILTGKTVTTEFANRHPGPDLAPAQPHAFAGRLVERLGCRGRRFHGAAGDRHANRRLGDPPGRLLRRRRVQASYGLFPPAGMARNTTASTRSAQWPARSRIPRCSAPPCSSCRRSRIDRGIARPRIGFCRTPIWDEASPDTKALLEAMASKLADKGASVVDTAFAAPFADILDDHGAITNYEGTRNYADERLRNPDKVSKELMDGAMKRGLNVSFERYVAAQRKSTAFRAHVDLLFDRVDVLLCPSAPGEAPEGVEFTGDPRFNSIWTLAGTPCVTLPAGTGAKGLPLGLQLVGLRHEDDRLLSTAAWVAAHLD